MTNNFDFVRQLLLGDSVILDTETLSLSRGSGMHEIAIYNLTTNKIKEFILDPNVIQAVSRDKAQEFIGLASSSKDQHQYMPGMKTWQHAIDAQLELDYPNLSPEERKKEAKFLYDALAANVYPHLQGNKEHEGRLARVTKFSSVKRAMLDPGGVFEELTGKTIWIANAAFESKQFGAQIDALINSSTSQLEIDALHSLKNSMETTNPLSKDFLYVTGVEVNQARTAATITGDWTQVFEAYVNHTPKKGETAVRDIQDLVKSFISYGQKAGYLQQDKKYHVSSIDLAYRIFAGVDDPDALTAKELHRAVEDAAISERKVLEETIKHNFVMKKLLGGEEVTDKDHMRAAKAYDLIEKMAGPELEQIQAFKRLQRLKQDFDQQGFTYQTFGNAYSVSKKNVTPDGNEVMVENSAHHRVRIDKIDEALDHVQSSYTNTNIKDVWEKVKNGASAPELEDFIKENKSNLSDFSKVKLKNLNLGPLKKGGLAAAGLFIGMSFLSNLAENAPSYEQNMISLDYQTWEAARLEGMNEQGLAKETRSTNTDFGSPYRGPMTSLGILQDQELQEEKERWLRQQYGATHYDPEFGLFSLIKSTSKGYKYIQGGRSIDAPEGLRGDSLKHIDLTSGDWIVSADDADTITVERNNRLKRLLGINEQYSFRLAGIDSTETAHGDKSYHAPQPYAETAKTRFQNILKNSKSLELIYDPEQTTYGRMMGVVYGDGKNLNTELVKQGIAAHLPFGKSEDSMIDYQSLKAYENKAVRARKGLWAEPWAQSFYEFSETTGNRVTFNTLASKSGLVKNQALADQLTIMEQAQAQGAYTPEMSMRTTDIAKSYSMFGDNVKPGSFEIRNVDPNNYQDQMMADLGRMMRTKGTSGQSNKFSVKNDYGKLNQTLVLDSMSNTTSSYSKRKPQAFETYKHQIRRAQQAELQRQANQQFGQSPINHHRM